MVHTHDLLGSGKTQVICPSRSVTEHFSVFEQHTYPHYRTNRTINMVASDFFKRFTHRSTHVASHLRWLEAKGARALGDWDDAGELDCMYGAVLKAAQFNNVKRIMPGVNNRLRRHIMYDTSSKECSNNGIYVREMSCISKLWYAMLTMNDTVILKQPLSPDK
jgi:hypothetical protein